MITTVCKISYGSQTVPPIVPAVQGDTGRAISFEIADFTPPAGATATYFILKPSGEAIYNSATITDNSILCELTAQSLAEAGENRMQVRVLQGEDIVTSFEVILMVRTFLGDDAMESGTEMNIFDQAVEQATEQFQENAEQIVEEVIESIPSDYTALTEEVDELNERIDNFDAPVTVYDTSLVVTNEDDDNLLDIAKLSRRGSIYVQSSVTGSPTVYTNASFYQSNVIKTTPGETIKLYGQMNNTTDFWVAVHTSMNGTDIASVDRCYQVYPSESIDGKSYAEITVPEDAQYMSFTGLASNLSIAYIKTTTGRIIGEYISNIEYNGTDIPILTLRTGVENETNLFDASAVVHPKLFVQNTQTHQPVELTGTAYQNFFQSAPIAVTPGQKLLAYGNMNNAIDFWVSVLNSNSSVTLSNVAKCFRVYPQRSVNNKSYAVITVPGGANWLSFSGAIYNADIIKIFALTDVVSILEETNKQYAVRDPFAIHFDSNPTLTVEQKGLVNKALYPSGVSGSITTPQAFGAVGDGVADDTAAIQAMINSSNTTFLFPIGHYKTTSPIVINKNNVTIIGEGWHKTRFVNSLPGGTFQVGAVTGVRFYNFMIETVDDPTAYAFVFNNTSQVSINFVDILGGSFRQTKSKCLKQEGNSWSTFLIYHCIWDCGATDDWAIELINTSSSARVCDCHIDDLFLDTVLATSAGCLRVDRCRDVHIQNSLFRTNAGTCVHLYNQSNVINEMSVLETFTANKPSVVVNSGTFQNRGGWNDKYDPA